MADATNDGAGAVPADPYPDYPAPYAFFFQAWLLMFLAVICLALVFYLTPYVQGI
jgi:hypothetical protein